MPTIRKRVNDYANIVACISVLAFTQLSARLPHRQPSVMSQVGD